MALYGVSFTVQYVAWDTSANTGKTGDSGNHTLRWVKDGTSAAPTNAPAEVDATNAPGLYKLVLTATEAQAVYCTLAGVSSTSNVSIMPVSIAFEQLPNAAPGDSGGLPTVADVKTQADAALTDYDAPTKAEMDTAFTEIKGATWSSGTDTLEALRDRGDAAWVTGGSGSLRLAKATATYNSATKELRIIGWLELAGELQDATDATLSLKNDAGVELIADGSFTKAENGDYTWLWTLADGSAINAVKNYIAEFTFTVGGSDYTRSVGFAGQGA